MIVVSIKKSKGVNKNVVVIISNGESKDILLNKTFLRNLMYKIQNKDHIIRSYKIIKIYVINNRCNRLALGYQI